MPAAATLRSDLPQEFSENVDVAPLLQPRPWTFCSEPFSHVRAENVFNTDTYRELQTAFEAIVSGRGLPSWPEARFSRNIAGYDAFSVAFDTRVGWPFNLFVSRSWHDLFARLFAIDAVGCMSGGLHHHAIGSRDGSIHNDLSPGWFVADDAAEEIVITRGSVCDYCSGSVPPDAGVTVRETIRGVAIIYYLNNLPWVPGDRGETGLYRSARDPITQPVVAVPPSSNSLLAFECTPQSFHTFCGNNRYARNSVIVWLHRHKSTVLERWGGAAIVPWS
jgi:hypothetical protein